jgi:hypothetical protein
MAATRFGPHALIMIFHHLFALGSPSRPYRFAGPGLLSSVSVILASLSILQSQAGDFFAVHESVRLAANVNRASGSQSDGDPAEAPASAESTTMADQQIAASAMAKPRLWAVEFGVGVISDDTVADYFKPELNKLHGPGGGQTYNVTVTRRIKEFDWRLWRLHLRPQIEAPARFTLVDENTGRVIPDVNLGLAFRWRDFPWNRFVRTSLSIGGGLSYSFQIWTAEYQRHPGEERSRLKFWLPAEFTFALPKWPEHQIVAFADHQSGGTLFDTGGVDAWGFGYRFEF